VDPVLEISGIRLDQKIGGKSGHWRHPSFLAVQKSDHKTATELHLLNSLNHVNASVLTLSDRCFRKEMEDTSGPAISKFLIDRGANLIETKIAPDDIALIQAELKKMIRSHKMDLLILTGGTGASPSDMTPEALASLWTKKIPGIGELLRASGSKHTSLSYLSRSEGGMIEDCLVISLPGSEKAVREGLEALEPLLPHLLHVKNGGKH
jgi:molybdenum cofactor synthesis domain-containing protein